MITLTHCPTCQSTALKTHSIVKDHSITKKDFTIQQCMNCQLLLTNPRPSEEKLPMYYQSENYVSHNDTKKGIVNTLYQWVKRITLRQKINLIQSYSSEKTLLDIGCGTGDFLTFASKKDWEVTGLEPDDGARKLALNKLPNRIFDLSHRSKLKDHQFAIITLWHVLEHVSDLNNYFKEFSRLLSKDGHLIIAVPNPESYDAQIYGTEWAAWDVPRHLYHFKKEALKTLALKNDFDLLSIKPMYFDAYYVSMLSEKYKHGNILKAAINGFISNLKAKKNVNHSSLIYILTKKTGN